MLSREEMYVRVVDPIRAAMKEGGLIWTQGWDARMRLPYNPTKKRGDQLYRGGINNLILMMASSVWNDPRWMGRSQARESGYSIRGLTNEKGVAIYAPILGWVTVEENGEKIRKQYVRGWKEVRVFNAQQIEGFPELPQPPDLDVSTGYSKVEAIYRSVNVPTRHAGNSAFYSPSKDEITLPEKRISILRMNIMPPDCMSWHTRRVM